MKIETFERNTLRGRNTCPRLYFYQKFQQDVELTLKMILSTLKRKSAYLGFQNGARTRFNGFFNFAQVYDSLSKYFLCTNESKFFSEHFETKIGSQKGV